MMETKDHRRDGTMMDTNKKNRELISALCDGEIPDADLELALAALGSPDGQQAWARFHQIGDVLRAAPAPDLSPGFAERLAARLAAEPLPGKRPAAGDAAGPAPQFDQTVAGPT
jgi:sigma-E factor negative regulatory protein RseA